MFYGIDRRNRKEIQMPIFEYLCKDCGVVSEHLVFSDAEKVQCPQCGSVKVQKILSATSSASGLKGEGKIPGAGDTGCCGSRPGAQGCIPGSCCGKA